MSVKQLGKFLRAERERRGWSQSRVARNAEMEQSYLSRIERGVGAAFPEPDVIERLAGVFGVSPDHLLKVAGYAWGDEARNVDPDVIIYTALTSMDIPETTKDHIRATIEFARSLRNESVDHRK